MNSRENSKVITVKDVARESGLSLSTVIQVLGGREQRYSVETRRKVQKMAQKMGYRRNSAASIMRRGKFDCVALLMSMTPGSTLLRQRALEGICDALSECDMHLSVARLPENELVGEELVPKMLKEWTADGLLVSFALNIPPRMIELVESSNLPCIWMRSKRERDCIYLDENDAAQQAVRHLVGLGHQRIALADCSTGTKDLPKAHYGVLDFDSGYREAMQIAGLEPRVIRAEHYVECTDRLDFFREVFAVPDRPTALVAYHTTIWPAVMAAIQEGLRIPDDISLVAVAEEKQDIAGISLTTLITPEYEIGRQAALSVVKRIRELDQTLPPCVLKFKLFEAGSCMPPKQPDKKKRIHRPRPPSAEKTTNKK